MKKIYIIRKYIVAKSAAEAIRKEKKVAVDDCWVEDNTHKEYLYEQIEGKKDIGFQK